MMPVSSDHVSQALFACKLNGLRSFNTFISGGFVYCRRFDRVFNHWLTSCKSAELASRLKKCKT